MPTLAKAEGCGWSWESLHDLRMVLPDVALAADKAELLLRPQPLLLECDHRCDDSRIDVRAT